MNMLLFYEICISFLFCVCNFIGFWMDKKDWEVFIVFIDGIIFDDI